MKDNQTVKERLIQFIGYLHIGQGKFEKNCGLPNAYVTNIRVSVTPKKLQQITDRYPELNADWLLTGEGEMLKGGVVQTANGDHNTQVAGTGNSVTAPDPTLLLHERAAQRQAATEAQRQANNQINRLLTVIEHMQGIQPSKDPQAPKDGSDGSDSVR